MSTTGLATASPRLISLFTGVGGLDYGFEQAGFETAVALEVDAACCANVRKNRDWSLIERDIHQTTTAEILEAAGLEARSVDVLIGGPPCQPFSKSGYWASGDAKRLEDPRADTLDAYLRILREALPKTFLIENVPGLAFKGKSEGLERIQAEINEINKSEGVNYRLSVKVLNAADYGAPQLRERIVIIGDREGRTFTFPEPKHGSSEDLLRHHSTWDAIGDLPEAPNEAGLKITGKWADLLPTIPEGQNYLWHTDRGDGHPLFGWRRRYWNFLLKLAKDRPSWTIQAQPGSATGPFHWNNRKLSARELCRLQTFPDDVVLSGSRNEIQRMIGNAVPSVLAEVLAWEIRSQLLGLEGRPEKYALEPPFRDDCPAPETLAKLPAKFRSLIGEHEAHPGKGKGNAAKNRRAA
ncbi:DNA cytosine methyltransferase [Salipiger thiooxidans]|uniref:DNA cytosine methyltransferase n=1 Tax=Salipiger thiooxidans TaxID=282683 RepID=UPI001CD4D13A|nr:DNA (cytosine-5-)-methyltransferase [Salipiger thiooxidans]MCA0848103.1 DNA cytosine methyltransferase [Salipiger thiooxidans]